MASSAVPGLGFFQKLNASQAGSLIGLTANCLQIYGFVAPLILSALGDSDTDEILDAIAGLEQKLDEDFSALGTLIDQQIALVLSNENAIALATAMAHTGTGLDKLIRYLRDRDAADLESADTESDLGIQFFLALPTTASDPNEASQTQPFFLPGIAKAGTVRVLVMLANDGTVREIPADVAQIDAIIGLAQGMIALVTTTVNNAHYIELKTTEIRLGPEPGQRTSQAGDTQPEQYEIIYDGYSHDERGQVLEFFSAGNSKSLEDPRLVKARAEAEAARAKGVAAELAFIGIPAFEALVAKWQALLVNPVLAGEVGAGVLSNTENRRPA